MTIDHWSTAIHEAGHAVAALALGGRCELLTLHPGGGGLACCRELLATDQAIVSAAGPTAEKLLSDTAPPPPERDNTAECAISKFAAAKRQFIARQCASDQQTPDEVSIARFCISGHETDPAAWQRRFDFVHAVAARIVHDHRDAILRVARGLFTRGTLSESQIKEFMQ